MRKTKANVPKPVSEIKRGTKRADGRLFYSYLLRQKKDGSYVWDELWLTQKAWDNKLLANSRWAEKNKERRRLTNRAWRLQNPDRHKENAQKWQEQNRGRVRQNQVRWVRENRNKVRATLKRHDQKMRATSPEYRLKKAVRCRIYTALMGVRKMKKTFEFLGCTVEQLRRHLESQFEPGMTWDNYGSGWHVDHVFPLAWFDLSDPDQQKKAFGLKNMQPMWADENSRKRDRFAGK
jgi:predicted transcriptional regulator